MVGDGDFVPKGPEGSAEYSPEELKAAASVSWNEVFTRPLSETLASEGREDLTKAVQKLEKKGYKTLLDVVTGLTWELRTGVAGEYTRLVEKGDGKGKSGKKVLGASNSITGFFSDDEATGIMGAIKDRYGIPLDQVVKGKGVLMKPQGMAVKGKGQSLK